MDRPEYLPWDQERHLGKPPWKDGTAVERWEKAHGHDVRLKCYPEYGCQALDMLNEYQRWLLWQFVDAKVAGMGPEYRAIAVEHSLWDEAAQIVGYDEMGQ